MTSLKQFLGGGAESSQPWGRVLGPGDRSGCDSSPVAAPRLHSHDAPHLSRASSDGAANWHLRGDLCLPPDREDLRGDDGVRTGLGDALTGDGDTFTGDDCSDSAPRSVAPLSIFQPVLIVTDSDHHIIFLPNCDSVLIISHNTIFCKYRLKPI